MAEVTGQSKIISLTAGKLDQVRVETLSEDRFFLSVDEAVEACTDHEIRAQVTKSLNDELRKMAAHIQDWCGKHPQVVRAVMGRRAAHPLKFILLLVTEGEMHNFDLDDHVAALDEELYISFRNFPVRIQTIPAGIEDGVECFTDTSDAWALYARPESAQEAG